MESADQGSGQELEVVVSSASVAALGLTGLAVASPEGSSNAPPAINIQDRRDDAAQLSTTITTHAFEVVPGPVTQFDSTDSTDTVDDTVLASADLDDSVDDSPDTASADDDSPDDSPIVSVDDSPVDDSVDDSPDDPGSLDSADSSD